jgi:precorrin-6Y C5,15-methyltransferase (decarboxylating)
VGSPQLAPGAAAILAAAQVLVGGKRLLAAFPDHPGHRVPIAGPLGAVCEAVAAAREEGLAVVVLADGDGLYFGIGKTLLACFGPAALVFSPNVTTVAAACSRLGRPWDTLPVVSLHGRSDATPLFAALARHDAVAVYTDPANSPAKVAAALLGRGGDGFAMTVFENLGLPGEAIRRLSLTEAAAVEAASLSLVLVTRTTPVAVPLHLGLGDDALLRDDAVFTKAPARAVALAALALRPGEVVWDIGAGTGAVALEASLLCAPGPVWAVERDPARHAHLVQNIRRTAALTVAPILAAAPQGLEGLPDPHGIFVGGGLSGNPDLLPALCRRLLPGGRLVVNAVLLGSLQQTLDALAACRLCATVTQLQAARGLPLAGDLRLAADNPVFIISARKEPENA